ncbi:MAG: hypothetical protein KGI37_01625 [Alphaproteobacteria bacterium]|nr:hypothetical protein [Alphaproteobacteria bacterium]
MDTKIIRRVFASIVNPPYRGVPWLILGYVVFCSLMLPYGGVYTRHLVGYDDQVRMVDILDWVNGAGWYDHTIMRANPPEGFATIWARLVDAPFALIILIAQNFVAQRTAALVAAAIVPLLYIAVLFAWAAPYFARPLVGKSQARLIGLFIAFTSILNLKYFSLSGFMIGQVSHHPWYVILNLTMFGAAARLAMGSVSYAPVFMLGGSIALLTAVGIEGYPIIAGAVGVLACVAWAANRPFVAARAALGVMCGAVASLLLLPLYQPPANFFAVSFAEPSILGPILIAVAATFLVIETFLLRRFTRRGITAFVLVIVACLFAAGLVTAFPDILNGAAAGLSPQERKLALDTHIEAQSIFKVGRTLAESIGLIVPMFMALAAGAWATGTARNGRRRAMFFCYLGFTALTFFMSALFCRYYHHAMTSSCAWLLWLWEKFKQRLKRNIHYSLFAAAGFVALGPFWMLLLPDIGANAPITTSILLFPAAFQAETDLCDTRPAAQYIDAHYPPDTLLIVPQWLSEHMLYQSDVRIDFVSNYPSHNKFIDNYAFFDTTDPDVARGIAQRHAVDLVAICTAARLYIPGAPLAQQSFAGRLETGQVPSWLTPIDASIPNYRLYRIDKKKLYQQGWP